MNQCAEYKTAENKIITVLNVTIKFWFQVYTIQQTMHVKY